jgi:hypothetical protein
MSSILLLKLLHGCSQIVITVEHPVAGGETVQSEIHTRIINHNVPIEATDLPWLCEINSIAI